MERLVDFKLHDRSLHSSLLFSSTRGAPGLALNDRSRVLFFFQTQVVDVLHAVDLKEAMYKIEKTNKDSRVCIRYVPASSTGNDRKAVFNYADSLGRQRRAGVIKWAEGDVNKSLYIIPPGQWTCRIVDQPREPRESLIGVVISRKRKPG